MKCPVCGHSIPALAEYCSRCNRTWIEGQQKCPAVLYREDFSIQCSLPFRHAETGSTNTRKHRTTLEFSDGLGLMPKVTVIWGY